MADSLIVETKESRRTQYADASRRDVQERIYYCEADDEDTLVGDLKTDVPKCINFQGRNLWAVEYHVRPIDDQRKFFGRVVYRNRHTMPRRQFDVNTGKVRIYESQKTLGYPGTACDYGNAIQVSGQGEQLKVEGVDIYSATLRYQEVHRLSQRWLDPVILGGWATAVGTANDENEFRGWTQEECLFLGFTAVPVPENEFYYDFTFEFAISPTYDTGIPMEVIGPESGPGSSLKYGWRYLWYAEEPREVGNCGVVTMKEVAVYQETIYDTYDLNTLFPSAPCEWDVEPPPTGCPKETHPYCEGEAGTDGAAAFNRVYNSQRNRLASEPVRVQALRMEDRIRFANQRIEQLKRSGFQY